MRREKERRIIIFIFMLGFLLGIIYSNLITENYVTITNIFHENYLNQYLQMKQITKDYFLFILQYRLGAFFGIGILATTRYRKIAILCFLVWTGFSAGVLAVTSVLSVGIWGMLICISALFPHFVFYIISYLIIILYCIGEHKIEWNNVKTVAVVLLQMTGIVTECYVNPWIMKALVGMIL